MDSFKRQKDRHSTEEDSWLSVSDMMAGLMIVFLFIAIVYIRPVVEAQSRIEVITSSWVDVREKIYQALKSEFADDLESWGASIQKETLTIRFTAPEILFETGTSELSDRFKAIIDSFFPRYLKTLSRFVEDIEEIRIEGHTSSEWSADSTPLEAYFKNMELSQSRTRSALEYAMSNGSIAEDYIWSRRLITANGLSSSKLITDMQGDEIPEASRRVEFTVRPNTEERIEQIIKSLEK